VQLQRRLLNAVDKVYRLWSRELGGRAEIDVTYEATLFVNNGILGLGAGLLQIKDYAKQTGE